MWATGAGEEDPAQRFSGIAWAAQVSRPSHEVSTSRAGPGSQGSLPKGSLSQGCPDFSPIGEDAEVWKR